MYPLNSKGFIISTIFFSIINIIAFILILNFNFLDIDKETCNYSLGQFFNILIIYILLFIGFGSLALLSQHVLIDSFLKLKSFKEEEKENQTNNSMEEMKNPKEFKYKKKKDSKAVKEKNIKKTNQTNNFDYYLIISIVSILGFFSNYFLNFYISNKKYEFDCKYNITFNNFKNETGFNITNINIIYENDKSLF